MPGPCARVGRPVAAFAAVGRLVEASNLIGATIRLYAGLRDSAAGRYEPDRARALAARATLSLKLGRTYRAHRASKEASMIFQDRELWPELEAALTLHATVLRRLDRLEEADIAMARAGAVKRRAR